MNQFIKGVRSAGGMLKLDGARILFTAPKGMPATEKNAILTTLRSNRDEILAYLVAELNPPGTARAATLAACGVTGCGGCYETELGLIHPPLPDPLFFQWRERMAKR